jgi:hypothetical protein
MLHKELVEDMLQLLIKAILCFITFTLSCSMHIQYNNSTLRQYYECNKPCSFTASLIDIALNSLFNSTIRNLEYIVLINWMANE